MKNYIQSGDTMDFTASANIAAGEMVLVGGTVGVAIKSVVSGAEGTLATEGVYEVPKEADDIAQGVALYFNASNKTATTTASTNKLIGYAWNAAGTAATTVYVRLSI